MITPEPMIFNNIKVENSVVGAINTGNVQAIIKATLGALSQAAGTVSAMSGAWQAAEPILKSLFGP